MVANFIFSKVNSLDNYKALKSPLLVTYYLKLFQFLPILFIAFPHANEECETKLNMLLYHSKLLKHSSSVFLTSKIEKHQCEFCLWTEIHYTVC